MQLLGDPWENSSWVWDSRVPFQSPLYIRSHPFLSMHAYHSSNSLFLPALSKFPSPLDHFHQCANIPVFTSIATKNKTHNKTKKKKKITSSATNTFLCFIFTVKPLENIIYTHHILLLSSDFLLTHSYQDSILTPPSQTAFVKVTSGLYVVHAQWSVVILLRASLPPPWNSVSYLLLSSPGFSSYLTVCPFPSPLLFLLVPPTCKLVLSLGSIFGPLLLSSFILLDSYQFQVIHMLMHPKFTSQPGPLPENQAYTSNCLLNTCTWLSKRYPTSFTYSHIPTEVLFSACLTSQPTAPIISLISVKVTPSSQLLRPESWSHAWLSIPLTCNIYQQTYWLLFKTFA